jgi:hypothetical protein
MRTLVLICSLAPAFAVSGAQEKEKGNKSASKKKQAQASFAIGWESNKQAGVSGKASDDRQASGRG